MKDIFDQWPRDTLTKKKFGKTTRSWQVRLKTDYSIVCSQTLDAYEYQHWSIRKIISNYTTFKDAPSNTPMPKKVHVYFHFDDENYVSM